MADQFDPTLGDPKAFDFYNPVLLRFRDLDLLGHVNNVALAGWLERSGVGTVVYSSCNVVSLARDLEAMPSLRPTRARLLDMFPQTTHAEVVVVLERTTVTPGAGPP